jgi:hypothetical protein
MVPGAHADSRRRPAASTARRHARLLPPAALLLLLALLQYTAAQPLAGLPQNNTSRATSCALARASSRGLGPDAGQWHAQSQRPVRNQADLGPAPQADCDRSLLTRPPPVSLRLQRDGERGVRPHASPLQLNVRPRGFQS